MWQLQLSFHNFHNIEFPLPHKQHHTKTQNYGCGNLFETATFWFSNFDLNSMHLVHCSRSSWRQDHNIRWKSWPQTTIEYWNSHIMQVARYTSQMKYSDNLEYRFVSFGHRSGVWLNTDVLIDVWIVESHTHIIRTARYFVSGWNCD